MRKPEGRIYQHVSDQIGIPLHQSIFLDDLDENVEGARVLGELFLNQLQIK